MVGAVPVEFYMYHTYTHAPPPAHSNFRESPRRPLSRGRARATPHMRPVIQTVLEPPHGNALQACVATLLDLPLAAVPNFVAEENYWSAMLTHAASHGLSVIKVPLSEGRLPFASAPGTRCIARGVSPRGAHGHVIIATVWGYGSIPRPLGWLPAPCHRPLPATNPRSSDRAVPPQVGADGCSLTPLFDPHPAGGFLAGPTVWAAFYTALTPAHLSSVRPSSGAAALPFFHQLERRLMAHGFDVLAPLRVSWYNEYLQQLGLATDSTSYLETAGEQHASGEAAPFKLRQLPDFGRGGNCVALLIGNSRAMWSPFVRWLASQQEPAAVSNPVDTYTEACVAESLEAAIGADGAKRADMFWAHDMSPERLVDVSAHAHTRAAVPRTCCAPLAPYWLLVQATVHARVRCAKSPRSPGRRLTRHVSGQLTRHGQPTPSG